MDAPHPAGGAGIARRVLERLLEPRVPRQDSSASVISCGRRSPIHGPAAESSAPTTREAARPDDNEVFAAADVGADARLLGSIFDSPRRFQRGGIACSTSAGPRRRKRHRVIRCRAAGAAAAGAPDRRCARRAGTRRRILGDVVLFEDNYAYPIFEKLVRRLLDGHTIGSVAELLSQREQLRTMLDDVLRTSFLNHRPFEQRRLATWRTAMIDARNYVVLGDPAVRYPLIRPRRSGTRAHHVPGRPRRRTGRAAEASAGGDCRRTSRRSHRQRRVGRVRAGSFRR